MYVRNNKKLTKIIEKRREYMRNTQKDWMFQSLISGLDKSMQATLNLMYHNSMMIDEENHRREMAEMKEEIIQ